MQPPAIAGIHHLKFPVVDIERGVAFYERVFGAKRLKHLDHHTDEGAVFAVILEFPHLGTYLELRLDPRAAAAQKGFDPVTLAVNTLQELQTWHAHFSALGVRHSPVFTGLVGWLLAVEDPDGRLAPTNR